MKVTENTLNDHAERLERALASYTPVTNIEQEIKDNAEAVIRILRNAGAKIRFTT